MQRIPLKERLGTCCLVSNRLRAAAVAATDCLDLESTFRTQQRVESGLEWIMKNGQQLERLKLYNFRKPIQQLPCVNLLELQLCGRECSVRLGPAADGQLGVIQGCTKLTRLELYSSIKIIDAPEGAVLDGGLSNLVHLQHLAVTPYYYLAGLHNGTLPRLQHLTFLRVDCLSANNLLQLGRLPKLQELEFLASDDGVGPSSMPDFAFPASLTKLGMWSPVEAGVLSLVPKGLQALQVGCDVQSPAEGPASLLHCVAPLHELTWLSLLPHGDGMEWPPAGPAYSAITASTGLVELELVVNQLPPGVWPYVFPSSHKLPHLTCLNLDGDDILDYGVAGTSDASQRWGAADLSSLVSCCPSLCTIHTLALQPGLHVSELQKLTALTRLSVCWYSTDVAECMMGLAAVTQLQSVTINLDIPRIPVASLLPLTSLTALTLLTCGLHKNHEDFVFGTSSLRISTQVKVQV